MYLQTKKFVPIFLTGPLQVLKSHNQLSPELSLFKAKQFQLFQTFIIGEVFDSCDHLGVPLLDSQVYVLPVLRSLELDAVLQVGTHERGIERQNLLPCSGGHTALDAAHGVIGFLG